ncbi:DUF2283 domain-containing protein [Acuticoccus mangrovi]|uniref:DUF2283 domain-containing protein n=1 Tax=Acuticoccus mangrovi TaxID=2796142 RepID=A0A934IN50_9HYPH|nr:DUF2283 domain-containing protein [Acuticoccus mangrovi]
MTTEARYDAASLTLANGALVESEKLRPGVVFDHDEGDRVVGIEILGARQERPASLPTPISR